MEFTGFDIRPKKVGDRSHSTAILAIQATYGTSGGSAMTRSPRGSENGPGDHFVVGNGDGAVDGEIQFTQRWNLQAVRSVNRHR